MRPDIFTSECFPSEYNVYRKDRDGQGGGVFIAVLNNLISSEVTELEPKAEEIWVKISVAGSKDLYACSHYRPNVTDKTSIPHLRDSLQRLSNPSSHIFIGGDFNLPDWDWEQNRLKPKAKEPTKHTDFIDLLHDHGLTQLVQKPTRLDNTLDLMITNNPTRIIRTEILPGISDHDAVLTELDISPTKVTQPKRDIPLYKKADWEALKAHVDTLNTKIQTDAENHPVETLWTTFRSGLEDGINQFIPHKTISPKYHLPWLTPSIRHLTHKKDRAYRAMKKSNSQRHRDTLKSLKAKLQRELRRAYWDYIEGIVIPSDQEHAPPVSKKFYTFLKHNKTDKSGIGPLRDHGTLHSDPREKAQILNKQFKSVFTNETILPLSELARSQLPSPYPHMPDIHISQNGILKLLQNLKPHKAAGPDKIKPIILRELSTQIAPILTTIFQKSLNTGEVPSQWRNAFVTPVYKKGSRYDPANYRPISLTCISCKILEHLMVSSIMKHSTAHNILHPNQHGFRQNRSCETQLLEFTSDLANNLKDAKQTDILVMDFSKAFDKVGHERLLHKLAHYGIRGRNLTWIRAFLSGRTQEVVVEGSHSNKEAVTSGVPQGSVLGPCLFLHYINDLPEGIRSTVRLFADDTIMYLTIANQTNAESLQADLDRLGKWEHLWQMEFHPGKCKVLTVTNKKTPIQYTYTLHGQILEHVPEAQYLGMTFKKDLNWNQHINNNTQKANRALGFLRRNLRINSIHVKQQAYFTYVRPIVEYASTVWDPYRAYQQHQIEMVQRRAARFVCNRYRRTSSVGDMLLGLQWESLQERRRVARLVMFYKMQTGLVATHPSYFLIPRPENPIKYLIPHSRIDSHLHSFFPSTARGWNRLSVIATQAQSLEVFKASVTK